MSNDHVKWIEDFYSALDDSETQEFIERNTNSISKSAYRDILLAYIRAVNKQNEDVIEAITDAVRDELDGVIFS